MTHVVVAICGGNGELLFEYGVITILDVLSAVADCVIQHTMDKCHERVDAAAVFIS